jgi:hypothetical protein
VTLSKCKEELNTLERARDTFKQQFLELREVNKDLKAQFKQIESQMQQLMS